MQKTARYIKAPQRKQNTRPNSLYAAESLRRTGNSSVKQEIPRVLRNPNMLHLRNKRTLPDLNLSQINLIQARPFYLLSTLILHAHLCLCRQRSLFYFRFLPPNSSSSPTRVTRVAHLNFRD